MGYPNFKNRIVQILAEQYGVQEEMAQKSIFNSNIERRIDEDMVWAQHMGSDFWANEIFEGKLLKTE